MNKSINTKEQLDALLQEIGRGSNGEFSASIGGRNFLSATKENATFYIAANDFMIIGADDNNRGHVAFCVPKSLVGDGPHEVTCYTGDLSWTAADNDNYQLIKSGRAKLTFLKKEHARVGVTGKIYFDFPDGGEIEGDFNIKLV
ncbi:MULTISPECIES: hypothetical protein [Pseudomonas]|jgi:hypothetical protein|uniref:Uncharacterized protein n=2 Tax=Pseudomonas TaxID=286 RepID=A0A2C5WEW7_PSEPU|nr:MULTISPECIES: hypothetical protein [Pseudomonas]MBY8958466.1 hypothetical protein [Pseudomonas sp. MIS38]PHH43846.1 hypothetical protein CRX57_27700 [Pseudomonas putida]QBR31712.1 hypothetical protein E3Z29_14725 [Pseudomonas sp. S150]QBX41257.1 hypothetical protein E4T63_11855 [Pseudomonas fluorescens]UZT95236.1 hypothetical protein OPS05_11870 [Pseudomonas koreensis]